MGLDRFFRQSALFATFASLTDFPRNPLIAQCLSYFHRIEERGSGIRRMRDAMLDHGLNRPKLEMDTGYFQVTLSGPDNDLDRLRVPASAVTQMVPPSIEELLNDRQRRIVALMAEGEEVTSWQCIELFGITRDTAARDFSQLVDLGLAEKRGAGRSTRYALASPGS